MTNSEIRELLFLKSAITYILVFQIGIIIVLPGCRNSGKNPMGAGQKTGTLQADVATTGQSPDTNGYSLLINGANPQITQPTDIVYVDNIETGTHTVELTDIQSNCSLAGSRSQVVNIAVDDTTLVTFEVVCKKRLVNKIVFASNRNGNFEDLELYIMNANGSDPTPLTQNGLTNAFPDISPDGTQVLYSQLTSLNAQDYQLRVIDADGTNDRALTTVKDSTNLAGSWSPDGRKILFSSNRNGNFEIFIINADGSDPVNISRSDSSDFTSDWSPDGSMIIFSSSRDGDLELYRSNTDGTGLVKLTNNTHRDSYPAWSPDGNKIAFSSNRTGNSEIFLMNSDGSGVMQLTNTSEENIGVTWSPDGTEIAFSSNHEGNSEIYKMRIDGSGLPVNLTAHPAGEDTPAWSPVQE